MPSGRQCSQVPVPDPTCFPTPPDSAPPRPVRSGENLFAEYTGSGVLNIYPSSEPNAASAAYASIFPLLDWHALGGVTAEHSTPIPACGDKTGGTWPITYTSFVGGVADGSFGAAALDYASHNTSARKSYFFLDRAIFAAASNLSNNFPLGTADVRTTLLSRLVGNATDRLTLSFTNGTVHSNLADGNRTFAGGAIRWAHLGGVGVWPAVPTGDGGVDSAAADFGVRVNTVASDWSTIGPYSGAVSGRVFIADLDHGSELPASTSQTAGFAYVIAPNVTAAQMPALDAGLAGASCLLVTNAVHGVTSSDTTVTMITFFDEAGGEYDCNAAGISISTLSAGLFILSRQGAMLTVTASHPTLLGGSLSIFVQGISASGQACTFKYQGQTFVTVPLPTDPSMMGSSTSVTCTLSGAPSSP